MKKIIHIDMDCFYAAVEMRDNPELRNLPIAVGGNSARGVLSTCNYIARQFGCRSAMPNHQAKKLCPDLVIVNGRMEVYKAVSQHIREIFAKYTDKIEPLSLDEAYLDVTGCELFSGSATLIAQQIRQEIFEQTQLTASAGVAPNKFLAKIASDENKPNGQCVISPDKVATFVENLPLQKIPGIGPKTAERLAKYGFHTCKDVRASNIAFLQTLLGKQASTLFHRSFGRDDREVQVSRVRKSLAVERTLSKDIVSFNEVEHVMVALLPKLVQRFNKLNGYHIAKQGVKLKFSDFNQTTVEMRSQNINEANFIELFKKAIERANNRKIRLVGLTLGFGERTNQQQTQSQLSFPIM